ncbi:hypothetical protein PMI40_02477, partial [Herbaspirillum sp. YR522]
MIRIQPRLLLRPLLCLLSLPLAVACCHA